MELSGFNSYCVSWIFPDVYTDPSKFENYGVTSYKKCRSWVFLDSPYYKEPIMSSAWLFPQEGF